MAERTPDELLDYITGHLADYQWPHPPGVYLAVRELHAHCRAGRLPTEWRVAVAGPHTEEPFDPGDDMTVPFALELTEKSKRIAALEAENAGRLPTAWKGKFMDSVTAAAISAHPDNAGGLRYEDVAAAVRKIGEQNAKLREFTQHRPHCRREVEASDDVPCTCGLAELLGGAP